MNRLKALTKIILVALCFVTATASPCLSIEVGEPAPVFSVRTFEGNHFSHPWGEGRALLLVFWNTWCPDCMRELPKINQLSEKYGPKGLAVLAVNTAMNDSEVKARAYWNKSGHHFPAVFDKYFELGQSFGVRGVPTILLIDSSGIVRYKQSRLPGNTEERLDHLTGQQ